MPSDYEVEGSAIVTRRVVDGHTLELRAESIRRERSGIHAKLSIHCDKAMLAWSNFNVERDEDRVRLANSAHKHINGMSNVYPANYMKNDLDTFCSDLWEIQVRQLMPVMMAGSLNPSPPEFVLYPFILKEGGTIIFAPPGRGKSYTLMLMAVCADSATPSVWNQIKQSKCLLINLERGARSVSDRLGNINAALGLHRYRPIATINARGKSLADVAPAAERYIAENDIGCVFVDSISRAGAGDLNKNEPVNGAADTLNRMCKSWVALAHTPRADESHMYGSVMFEAAADVVVQLLSEQEEDGPLGIGLQITKQNDIGHQPLWTMALEFNDLGLLRVRNARPGEFPDVEAGRKMTMREQVREHLKEIGSATATQIAKELSLDRSNVSMLLSSSKWFARVGKDGRNVLYGLATLP
jgi:hypothetical protein